MIIYRWWGGVCDRVCLFSGLRKCLFKEFHKKGLLTDFGFDLKLEVTLRVNLNLDLGFFRKCTCKITFRFMKPAQFCSYHRAPVTESVIQNHHSDYYCHLPRPQWDCVGSWISEGEQNLIQRGYYQLGWISHHQINTVKTKNMIKKKKTHHYYIFLKF